MGVGVWGLRFGVWGFRVQGLRFRVSRLGTLRSCLFVKICCISVVLPAPGV